MVSKRQKLYAHDMAHAAGIQVGSFRRERLRAGVVPEPDGYEGRHPFWWGSTKRSWLQHRRPKGFPKDAWKGKVNT